MTQLFHRRHILKTLASIPLIGPLLPVCNSVTEATLIDNGKSYSLKLGLPSDEPILSYTESMMEFGIPGAIKYKALTDKGYSHFESSSTLCSPCKISRRIYSRSQNKRTG